MIVSGCALAIAPSSVPTSPSFASARIVSDSNLVPVLSFGATSSSIACITAGIPAMVITFPVQKPGAPDTLFATSLAPPGLREPFLDDRYRFRMKFQRHAECFRHAIGRDVVMSRSYAARGEDIGVFGTEPVERVHDCRGVVGNHPHFSQVDPDGREIIGDIADIPVLGAARQDFVADHQHGSGDDVGLGAHPNFPKADAKTSGGL